MAKSKCIKVGKQRYKYSKHVTEEKKQLLDKHPQRRYLYFKKACTGYYMYVNVTS